MRLRPYLRIVGLFIAALTLSISSINTAHSAVKAGSSCTKIGKVAAVGKLKLTCIKSGKKLVWGKSAPSATKNPLAPTPVVSTPVTPPESGPKYQPEGCHSQVSATLQKLVGSTWIDIAPASQWEKIDGCDGDHPFQPSVRANIPDGTMIRWHIFSPGNWDWFSTVTTVKTIVQPMLGPRIAAIAPDKFQDVAAMAQSAVTTEMPAVSNLAPITYTFEDSIYPIERAVIKNGAESTLTHFSPFFDPDQKIHIFVFGTSQFLKSEAPKADPTNQAFVDDMARQSLTWGKRTSDNCVGMGGFAVPEVPFPFIAIDAPCKTNDPAAYGVLPHELTHSLQFAYAKANSRCWAPVWLVEGQAQVGASALAYDEKGPASTAHRKSWVERIVKPTSIDSILAMEGETKDYSEYTLGAALSEYLVAKGGWKRSLNLYVQASNQMKEGCLSDRAMIENFDKAFQSLYGQTLADFYSEALPYLQWIADHK